MRFEQALEENQPLEALGEFRFSYERSLLIGRAHPGSSTRMASLLKNAGAATGGVALLLLVVPTAPIWLTAVFTALSALGMTLGSRVEKQRRIGRTVVLNFATETLRLDRPARLMASPRSVLISFNAVNEVLAVERRGGFALLLTYRVKRRRVTTVLVDSIRHDESAALAQGTAFFRAAFGLKPPPLPAAGDPSQARDEWLPPSPRPPSR